MEARNAGISRLYGLLSERYMEELKVEIPEVDAYFGKFNWQNILSELGEVYHEANKNSRILTTPSHYAYIKISEGCNRDCSFCAIPLITGRHRSREIEDIAQEISDLTRNGVKEFQLIAQDLSYYGKDIYKDYQLAIDRNNCRYSRSKAVAPALCVSAAFSLRYPADYSRT